MTLKEKHEEFYEALSKKTDEAYNKDFYDWAGHHMNYTMELADFVEQNKEVVTSDNSNYVYMLMSIGAMTDQYYWKRRETDTRDPDLWLPIGYHGSAHTCNIQPPREEDCAICEKIELHNKEIK